MLKHHEKFYDPWGQPTPLMQAYAGLETALEAVETAQELMLGRRSGQPLNKVERFLLDRLRFIAVEADNALVQLIDDWRDDGDEAQLEAARAYATTARFEAIKLQLMAEASPGAFQYEAEQQRIKNDAIYQRELKAGRIYGLNPDGSKKDEA